MNTALLEQFDLEKVEAQLFSRSFRDFVRAAWPVVEGATEFKDNWHIGAICEHLEAVTSGQITKLLINVSPGCSKSLLTSVFWPAWEWTKDQTIRWFMASYDLELAHRDARKTRDLLLKDWYQDRWPLAFRGDANAMGRYETTEGGFRISTLVGGHGTGEHPDRKVFDDPLSREKAASEAELRGVIEWYDQTMSTRGVARQCREVIIMQRLADRDLSGHVLSTEAGFVHLCLPMRYEPRRMVTTTIGFNDPRTKAGELMAPEQFSEAAVSEMERRLGSIGAAGQLQQRPAPAGGALIKRDRIRFWQPKGDDYGPVVDREGNKYLVIPRPDTFDQTIQSWDTSFMDELGQIRKGNPPDPVAGGVFGRRRAGIYLLDRVNGVMDVNGCARAVLTTSAKWPKAIPRLIENKANGAAVMAILRDRGVATVPIDPQGSKIERVSYAGKTQRHRDARAMSMAAMIEAGEYFLPSPNMPGYAWVWDYFDTLVNFPSVPHDDDVDMTSQAFLWLSAHIQRDLEDEAKDAALGPPPKDFREAVHRERERQRKEREAGESEDPMYGFMERM